MATNQAEISFPMDLPDSVADPPWWLAVLCRRADSPLGNARTLNGGVTSQQLVHQGRDRSLWLLGDADSSLPAQAGNDNCAVVFDGVLYNPDDLTDRPGGKADPAPNPAAIIMEAYGRLGEAVLPKLRGTFGLLIWDKAKDLALLVRDPMGLYPAFYAEGGTALLFSTAIEPLIQHPAVSRRLNRAVLAEHLCGRWSSAQETYFAQVKRVPPGHARRVGDVERVYRYWDPHPPGTRVKWVEEFELEQFDVLLDQAVNRCLNQGTSGIFLSGGLDSGAVALVASQNCRSHGWLRPWALSLAFPEGSECEEAPVQQGVAARLELPQVMVPFAEAAGPRGLLGAFLEWCPRFPTPSFNIWLPAYHYLGLEGKKRGCQAILRGTGGDEWLGVSPFLAADLWRSLDLKGLRRLGEMSKQSFQLSTWGVLRNVCWTFGLKQLALSWAAGFLRHNAPGCWETVKQQWVSRRIPVWVAPDEALKREIGQRLGRQVAEPAPEGFYFRETRHSLDHYLVTMELEETFQSGRLLGLKFLAPFQDADLVAYLYRTPPDLLVQGGRNKGLVRQSLARRLPGFGFEQQKKVAATNFMQYIVNSEAKILWGEIGGVRTLAESGLVDPVILQKTTGGYFADTRYQHFIRLVMGLEVWLREYR